MPTGQGEQAGGENEALAFSAQNRIDTQSTSDDDNCDKHVPRTAQHGREACGEAVAVTTLQIPQAGWHLQSPGSNRAPATDGCDPA